MRFGMVGEGFEAVREDGRGRQPVRVHFADGAEDWYNVLIGAGGSGSRVRTMSLVYVSKCSELILHLSDRVPK